MASSADEISLAGVLRSPFFALTDESLFWLVESGGSLNFSTDTLRFDTVFTALASATQAIKIFNPQNERVVLSSVRLEGGNASFFQLNVEGRSGRQAARPQPDFRARGRCLRGAGVRFFSGKPV